MCLKVNLYSVIWGQQGSVKSFKTPVGVVCALVVQVYTGDAVCNIELR